jgi:hypothetical protein
VALSKIGKHADEKSRIARCLVKLRDIRDVYKGVGESHGSVEHECYKCISKCFGKDEDIFAAYIHHMMDEKYQRVEIRQVERIVHVPAQVEKDEEEEDQQPVVSKPTRKRQRLQEKEKEKDEEEQQPDVSEPTSKRQRPQEKKKDEEERRDMSAYLPVVDFISQCVKDYMRRSFYNGDAGINYNQYHNGAKKAFSRWMSDMYGKAIREDTLRDVFGGRRPMESVYVMPDGRSSRRVTRYIPKDLVDTLRKEIFRVQHKTLMRRVQSHMKTSHDREIHNYKHDEPFMLDPDAEKRPPSEFKKASIKAARQYNPVVQRRASSSAATRVNLILSDDTSADEEEEEAVDSDADTEEYTPSCVDDDYGADPRRRLSTSDSIGAILRDSTGGTVEDSNASIDFTEKTRELLRRASESQREEEEREHAKMRQRIREQETANHEVVLDTCSRSTCTMITCTRCPGDSTNPRSHIAGYTAMCRRHVAQCANTQCDKKLCLACINYGVEEKYCYKCGLQSF